MQREANGVWWNGARAVFYPTKWMAGPHLFVGQEHIPAGGALVVANHISYLDPIYTGIYFDKLGRMPRFLAKDAVFRIPVIGKLATELGQIPVYRDSSDAVDSLREADAALAAGRIVIVYPEGTITRDPRFWPMRAHTGAARLALKHPDVPVIPMAHWNTQLIYDHYAKKFRPFPRKRVVVQAGPPVDMTAFHAAPLTGDTLRAATDHLMSAVRDVLAAVRGEPAPTEFHHRRRDRG